jgi:hypothetical protein
LLRALGDPAATDAADPNELVELETVSVAFGPMVVDALRSNGLQAHGHEAFNLATRSLTDYRIVVPRSQWARANEVLTQ